MQDVYIYSDSSYRTPVTCFYTEDYTNNKINLNIKLPDYMVGELFSYRVCFEKSDNTHTSTTPDSVVNDICQITLGEELASCGFFRLQIMAYTQTNGSVGAVFKTPVFDIVVVKTCKDNESG